MTSCEGSTIHRFACSSVHSHRVRLWCISVWARTVNGMTPDADLELRVARLENDRDAIYELIDDFRSETRTRFDQVDRKFGQVEGRLGQVEGKMGQVEGKIDRIETTLVEVLRRLPEPT